VSRAIVIGGGIAGIATSALLARDGYEVTLVERRDQIGGRAGSWEHEGFRFDTGPSWYLMPEVFDHWFRLLGTTAAAQLDLVQLDPSYRVFAEGHREPVDVPASIDETLEVFEKIEPGSAKKLATYLDRARETYELAKSHFLYTTFEKMSPVFDRQVRRRGGRLVKLLTEPLGSLVKHTVRDLRLRQILGYPAVFLGASPKIAPSMYSLMSHLDMVDGVRYPMGGFYGILERMAELARAQGVDIRTGVDVEQILVEAGSVTGVRVSQGGSSSVLHADVVVSTADLHHTETVLLEEPEQRTYPEEYWEKKIAGPSALLIYLGVKGALPQLEHHTLLFAAEWDKNFDQIFGDQPRIPDVPSLYVCKPSGVDPSVAPEGHENVFVLVPLPADPSLGSGGVDGAGDESIEKLADEIIEQIGTWAGIPDLASRIVVRRTIGPQDFVDDLNSWKGTALGPAHTLRQSAFFRAGNKSDKVRGLLYAGGSTIPGIGLPMCLISSELVIKRLRGDTTTGPMREPLQPAHRTAS